MENVKNYIFNKLFFPKVIIINKPGVILTKVVKKYGKESSKGRLSYIFEDILVDLQLESIKQIGRNRTSKIWYMIGKDSVISYFLVTDAKKPPSLLLDSVLNYILNHFLFTGTSISTKIKFNRKNMSLVLKGKNNIVHRKTAMGSVLGGITSSILSFLTGENIEAKTKSYYENNELFCKIICNKNIPMRYVVNYDRIKNLVKKYKSIMPKENAKQIFLTYKNLATFNQFLKFKQIKFTDKIFSFYNKPLLSGEINSSDHIIYNYLHFNLLDLLKKSVTKSSEKIIKQILKNKKLTQQEKLKFIQNMMSAFGWGIPLYEIKKDKITFDFIFGAQATTNSFLFYTLQLNGFLNYIFNKKIKLMDVKMILTKVPISRAVYKL